jgi:hypothetical protein
MRRRHGSSSTLLRYTPAHPRAGWFVLLGWLIVLLCLGAAARAQPPADDDAWLFGPANEEETREAYVLIDACTRTSRKIADHALVVALLRLETRLGLPAEMRGILPSVWCIESSMRTRSSMGGPIYGDFLHGAPRAYGPLQIHGWMYHWCGGDKGTAQDLLWSARCWVKRMQWFHPKAVERCGPAGAWGISEAMTANPIRYKWRCDARSFHYKVMINGRRQLAD